MNETLAMLQHLIVDEAVGLIGGALFFGSWVFQAWESRRAGTPVVSVRFFVLRALASALMAFEGMRSGSLSLTLVMVATMFLMLYNVRLAIRRRPRRATGDGRA